MKINELSQKSGIHLETIRYYEKIGLLPEPNRDVNGYRIYTAESLKMLNFIKTCRSLGFSIDEIRQLQALTQSRMNHHQADYLVAKRLNQVEEKILRLNQIRDFLKDLVNQGEHSEHECRIMLELGARD